MVGFDTGPHDISDKI